MFKASILVIACMALLCGCDVIKDRMTFEVAYHDGKLSICTEICIDEKEQPLVNEMFRPGEKSFTTIIDPKDVWQASTLTSLIDVIKKGKVNNGEK